MGPLPQEESNIKFFFCQTTKTKQKKNENTKVNPKTVFSLAEKIFLKNIIDNLIPDLHIICSTQQTCLNCLH